MKNEEILKQAIKKAQKKGYTGCKRVKQWHYLAEKGKLESIIFSHSFAKAFWGTEAVEIDCMPSRCYLRYAYHLQIMVLESEPLLYLKKFL